MDQAGAGRRMLADIASAILLSVAALASSWAGYQSKRWSGVQSSSYNASATLWVQSFRAATFAYLYRSVDLELFIEWLNAYEDGDKERAIFFEQRFRSEFRPAFEAWLATRPWENPAAPSSPYVLPEYRSNFRIRPANWSRKRKQPPIAPGPPTSRRRIRVDDRYLLRRPVLHGHRRAFQQVPCPCRFVEHRRIDGSSGTGPVGDLSSQIARGSDTADSLQNGEHDEGVDHLAQ